MSDKVFRPALAVIALGIGMGPARAQMALTKTDPLPNIDRFADIVSTQNMRNCFAHARMTTYGEGSAANGLLLCAITPHFTKIQAWMDKTQHDDHPGRPDLTLMEDAPNGKFNGRVFALVSDVPARVIPIADPGAAATTSIAGDDDNASDAPRRKVSISVLRESEFLKAAPRLAGAISIMKAAY